MTVKCRGADKGAQNIRLPGRGRGWEWQLPASLAGTQGTHRRNMVLAALAWLPTWATLRLASTDCLPNFPV